MDVSESGAPAAFSPQTREAARIVCGDVPSGMTGTNSIFFANVRQRNHVTSWAGLRAHIPWDGHNTTVAN